MIWLRDSLDADDGGNDDTEIEHCLGTGATRPALGNAAGVRRERGESHNQPWRAQAGCNSFRPPGVESVPGDEMARIFGNMRHGNFLFKGITLQLRLASLLLNLPAQVGSRRIAATD